MWRKFLDSDTDINIFSHQWHISEEERVSFSPSRQGGSEEEVGAKKTNKIKCL